MVGLIWKSLFGQNWGRAASQLVPNKLANISLSVPVQLREQMRCLFTDRCNWKLRSTPNCALPQWRVLKKLCGHLAITQAAGQETRPVELGQGNIQESSHWLLCCSQLYSTTSGGGSSTEQSIKMKFLLMVLIQLSKPSAEAPAETGGVTVLFILADELEEF